MSIHQLLAAINPDVFCEPSARRQVKGILSEAQAIDGNPDYAGAAAKATPIAPNQIAIEHLEQGNPFELPGIKCPIERRILSYDAFDESLEAFYFWLLDELTTDGWAVDKLADTFAATPAAGLFSDLTRRESQAQREAMKMLKEAHALVRDILRTTTLLKQGARFADPEGNEAQPDYKLERNLLKSKTETLKLYARWLGPYLRQARETKQSDRGGAAMIHLFNTATAEVILLAQKKYPVAEDVDRGDLPKMFLKANHRSFYQVLVIEWRIRAAPERNSSGGYGYRGRFDLTLTSYALNGDELAVLRRELDRADLNELVRAFGEDSAGTLDELLKEIEFLVKEPTQPEPAASDPNPFTALFDFSDWFAGEKGEAGRNPDAPLQPDSEIEEVVRSQALLEARRCCHSLYNRTKQVLRMPVMT